METYALLQHYWWFIISLLGAILVFLLFVQGGQSMLYCLGRTDDERTMIVNSLGRKWEFTFTTLVTFGGAFFASFPLFYSTSFGGAFYVWMAILFVFVIQAIAYEFRRKPNNFLGERTYEAFLVTNGLLGPFLLGTAVGTLFTGGNFTIDTMNLANIGGNTTISQWTTPWRGLEALTDYRNVSLGLAVMFLARVLAIQYFMNDIDNETIDKRAHKMLPYNFVPFVVFFLIFAISITLSNGWAFDPETGLVSIVPLKYFNNLMDMPIVLGLLLIGVLSVLLGSFAAWFSPSAQKRRTTIWITGSGTIVTVLALLLMLGFNDTCYYPSLSDTQSSLSIYNSSSSQFTLTAMSIVSIMIPFVVAYIWYAWRSMNRVKITHEEIKEDKHLY